MILDSGTNRSSVGHLMTMLDSWKIPPQSSKSMGETNSIRGLFQFNRQLTLINNQFPLATRIGVERRMETHTRGSRMGSSKSRLLHKSMPQRHTKVELCAVLEALDHWPQSLPP